MFKTFWSLGKEGYFLTYLPKSVAVIVLLAEEWTFALTV